MQTWAAPISPEELEARARQLLDPKAYDYIAGGAEDEITLRANRDAFTAWRFRPRVLSGVEDPDLSLTLLGHELTLPVLLGPVAVQRLAHPDGELASAAAAAAVGTLFCLSTLASTSIEEVAGAAGPRWFQLYPQQDRDVTRELVDRAIGAGYSAVIVTADVPIVGRRERDERNRFSLPAGVGPGNFVDARGGAPAGAASPELSRYVAAHIKSGLSWSDLEWVVEHSSVPVLVKGVVRGNDAARAVQAGAAGIVVSNHGGRQLDRTAASVDVLADVLAAVGGAVPVLLDGGVRRGSDVLIALCLGATAVLLGRPYIWALAVGGQGGVVELFKQLRAEITAGMMLLGAGALRDLTPDLLSRAPAL